jgi:chemotaxis protein MotA
VKLNALRPNAKGEALEGGQENFSVPGNGLFFFSLLIKTMVLARPLLCPKGRTAKRRDRFVRMAMRDAFDAPREIWRKPKVIGAAFGGFLVLCSLILGARSGMAFLSLGGLAVVVGGVIATAFLSFDEADVKKALGAVKGLFDETPEEDLRDDMTRIVGWARLYRERGLLALEAKLKDERVEDPFLRYGLNMVLGEYPAEDVRAMMETAADAAYEREGVPVDILHAMASHAPAFGMVGTLIGMMAMLSDLDQAIAQIGASLAVAFLSTLYGVLSARMVYMPAAAKLEKAVTARRFRAQLIAEGMSLLAGEKAPLIVQDRLNSFLCPDERNFFNSLSRAKPALPPRAHLRAIGA